MLINLIQKPIINIGHFKFLIISENETVKFTRNPFQRKEITAFSSMNEYVHFH